MPRLFFVFKDVVPATESTGSPFNAFWITVGPTPVTICSASNAAPAVPLFAHSVTCPAALVVIVAASAASNQAWLVARTDSMEGEVSTSVPAVTAVPPWWALMPDKVRVPEPILVSVTGPSIVPAKAQSAWPPPTVRVTPTGELFMTRPAPFRLPND